MSIDELSSVVETLLFIVGEPLDIEDIETVTNESKENLERAIEKLSVKYSEGVLLKHFGTKLQFCTNPKNARFVEDLLNPIQKKSLSQAALEVLSIIAYRQPVTRGEIEQIRGVKCDYSVLSLKQKGLIEEVGHKDVIGRPVLFGTTDLFLRHFDLKSLDDLPMQENLAILENSEFDGDSAEQLSMDLPQDNDKKENTYAENGE